MNTFKKILTLVVALLVLVFIVSLSGGEKSGPQAPQEFEPIDSSRLQEGNLIPSITNITLPESRLTLPGLESDEILFNLAWDTFQRYLTSAKNHDLGALRDISYQISDVCNDPNQEEECFLRMNNVYEIGTSFKKEDFKNIWADEKQIIISSEYSTVDEPSLDARGIVREIIYFTRDDLGNPRVLSLNNLNGSFTAKKSFSDEELDEYLVEQVRDSDEDGVPDEVELCEGSYRTPSCQKTDPNKRDSDGDGWWDGIEIFFYNNL